MSSFTNDRFGLPIFHDNEFETTTDTSKGSRSQPQSNTSCELMNSLKLLDSSSPNLTISFDPSAMSKSWRDSVHSVHSMHSDLDENVADVEYNDSNNSNDDGGFLLLKPLEPLSPIFEESKLFEDVNTTTEPESKIRSQAAQTRVYGNTNPDTNTADVSDLDEQLQTTTAKYENDEDENEEGIVFGNPELLIDYHIISEKIVEVPLPQSPPPVITNFDLDLDLDEPHALQLDTLHIDNNADNNYLYNPAQSSRFIENIESEDELDLNLTIDHLNSLHSGSDSDDSEFSTIEPFPEIIREPLLLINPAPKRVSDITLCLDILENAILESNNSEKYKNEQSLPTPSSSSLFFKDFDSTNFKHEFIHRTPEIPERHPHHCLTIEAILKIQTCADEYVDFTNAYVPTDTETNSPSEVSKYTWDVITANIDYINNNMRQWDTSENSTIGEQISRPLTPVQEDQSSPDTLVTPIIPTIIFPTRTNSVCSIDYNELAHQLDLNDTSGPSPLTLPPRTSSRFHYYHPHHRHHRPTNSESGMGQFPESKFSFRDQSTAAAEPRKRRLFSR